MLTFLKRLSVYELYKLDKSLLPKTLPPCTTIIKTVILHGWCVGECWGDAGHDMSMLADVLICNLLLLRSLVIRCRYEGENIVSSENVPIITVHVKRIKLIINNSNL